MKAPESASTDGTADGTLARVAKKQVSRRRVVVRGTAATVAGVVAASYVKPSLQGFSFGTSTAIGAPTPGQTDRPPPTATGKCSIAIDIFTATCSGNTISGTVTVENKSSSPPCPTCVLTNPQIIVEQKSLIPSGTGCGDITPGAVRASQTFTGGSNSLTNNTPAPTCTDPPKSYTFSISSANITAGTQYRVTFLLDVVPSPQHDDVFHNCADAVC